MASGKRPARTKRNISTPIRKVASFPIVGIGASAGGLEAFSDLLGNLPEKTGMAFVFIQHLDPSHGSVLTEILSRTTKIPVSEVTDGMAVAPNHAYVIPANTSMIIKDRVLRLAPRELTRGQHMPVDHFFESLATDIGDQAISVVLSGTGGDGTQGCGAVKAAGGITFAQDEQSAKYASMPRTAIAASWIDFVLPPAGIAKELTRIGRHPYLARASTQAPGVPSAATKDASMQSLWSLVREATGVDFTHYKQSTLERRISRRLVVLQLETLNDYLRYIKSNPDELDKLYGEMLIHVTGFFRDPASFDALTKRVFPAIVQENKPIRIWVPGCSTGEEVYSIAIVLLEHLWEIARKSPSSVVSPKEVQFFATDISDSALDRARQGLYSGAAISGVSPERLKQFFLPVDGGYRINKSLREMCIFAKHNLTSDPPFSNLDLVSCRNLLIYLGPHLQHRVIPIFHYALKPNGYLMLGGSESLGEFGEYFTLLDKRHRIYRKKQTAARLLNRFAGLEYVSHKHEEAHAKPQPDLTIGKELDRVLMNRFIPPSIVVNNAMEIVQIRGKIGAFLEPAAGPPTFTLSKMVREELLVDVRAALTQAKKQNTSVRREGVHIRTDGDTREVDLEVVPIRGRTIRDHCFLIVFHEPAAAPAPKGRGKPSRSEGSSRESKRLDRQVVQLREQVQSLIEDHETTLEEFKTANEEVLSSNEELQSTNEELETAKEELQSSNEELITLNEELQNRNSELAVSNNDLSNLLANANIPVLMIGNDLRIRRFTPQAQELLNLIPADIGRHFGQIKPNLDSKGDIEGIVRETIDTAILQEIEVHHSGHSGGHWYSMRVRPYKTWDNKIDGAVVSFQDIDALKRRAEISREFAESLIENAREPTVVLDDALRIVSVNRTFCEIFDVSQPEVENRSLFEIGHRQWDSPAIRDSVNSVAKRGGRIDDFEVQLDLPRLGAQTFLLNARRITLEENRPLILVSAEDATAKKQNLEVLRRHLLLLELAHETIIVRNLEGKILLWNRGAEELYGWNKQEALGKSIGELLETKFPRPWKEIEQELLQTERWEGLLTHKVRDGSHKVVSSRWAVLKEEDGVPVILEINSDISKQLQVERELRQLSGRLLRLQDEERRRIAREIHDSTGQSLTALKINLDSLAGNSKPKAESDMVVAESITMVEDIIRETRTLSQILHPPDLDTLGLLAAIRSLANGFSLRSGIPVQVDGPANFQRLPGDMEIALYRIAQESLTNIHRHSGATKASIQISQTPEQVTLAINDNGKGMLPDGDADGTADGPQVMGVGVLGMKERLSQLQGNLEITSGKGGTTVAAAVPVRAVAAAKT